MTDDKPEKPEKPGPDATPGPPDDAGPGPAEPEEPGHKDAAEPSPGEDAEAEVDEGDLGRSATVINNFFAQVDASASVFGIGTRPASGSVTGTLDAASVDRAIARFAVPPRFEEMVARLRERRVLLLAGPEGSGRWTGAVRLLTRMGLPDRRITMYSPARGLDDLPVKQGRGHLIHDWICAEGTGALQRFQFDALREKLAAAGSYLVITVGGDTSETGPDDYRIHWEPPDPREIFDAHLGDVAMTPEIAEVRDRVGELRSAHRIAELAGRVTRGERSPAELLADASGDDVRAWFEKGPGRSEVLVVAALAFAYGLPERVFERLLVALSGIADDVKRQGREPERRPEDDELPQERARWRRGHPLIALDRADLAQGGERRVVFRGAHHRRQVIEELVDQYGYQLWEPLRMWIRSLPQDGPELQVQVAAGLAVLAGADLREVQESFLDVWAAEGWRERLAAANVLSLMCADDRLAPAALRTALDWVANAGQPRAMTAALAFAGGLAIRYPADSVDWLWFLTLRGIRVSVTAQRALTLLFQSAAERNGSVLPALLLLAAHVDGELLGDRDRVLDRRALAAVLAVLECDRLEAEDEPLAAWMLLSEPESARPLGVLWGWTLRSAHHRGDAVRALRRTLEGLEGREGALEAARELGTAVWTALPDGFAVLARRAIHQATVPRGGRETSQKTRELVLALLGAGGGRA